jgi:hypothetical protein
MSCSNALLSVNGHTIEDKPKLLLSFRPSRYFLLDDMRSFAAKFGKTVDDIRQWRIVSFPVSWLNMSGSNTIQLAAPSNTAVTIYGDYLERSDTRRHLPTFDYFSAGKLCNATEGFEGRLIDQFGWPPVSSSCWRQKKETRYVNDLSTDPGKQTGEYRLFLVLHSGPVGEASTIVPGNYKTHPLQIFKVNETLKRDLSPQDFDPLMASSFFPDSQLRINRYVLKAVSSPFCQIEIPKAVLQNPFLGVKVSGYLRATKENCTVSVLPILIGKVKIPGLMVLPATPPCFTAESNWSYFEISDVMPTTQLGGLKFLRIALFPGRWEEVWEYGCNRHCGDSCFKNIRVELEALNPPQIEDQSLKIY